MKLKFELTNQQRKYLGLIPVEKDWELVKFDGKFQNTYYYFDSEEKIIVEITIKITDYYLLKKYFTKYNVVINDQYDKF